MSNEYAGTHNGELHDMFYKIGRAKEQVARGINEKLKEELEAAKKRRAQLIAGTVGIDGVDENTTVKELEEKIRQIEMKIAEAENGESWSDTEDTTDETPDELGSTEGLIEPEIEILEVSRKGYDYAFLSTACDAKSGVGSYAFIILPRDGQRITVSQTVETGDIKIAGFVGATKLLEQIENSHIKSAMVYMDESLCKLLRRNAAFGIVDGYSKECECYVAAAKKITASSDIRFTFSHTDSKYMDIVGKTASAMVE